MNAHRRPPRRVRFAIALVNAVGFTAVAHVAPAHVAPAHVAPAQSDTAAAIVRGELGNKADAALQALVAQGLSGTVLVAKDGNVLLKKGYGMSNRALKIPMTANSVVQIGSNTKDFTAVAILQLHENGLINISDAIDKYFPNLPADKKPITIRQLLNHRAGFEQHIGQDFDVVSKKDYLDSAFKSKLLFVPGEGRGYSNTGFSILAAIIEQVSHKTYDEYVRDNILQPLHLTSTGTVLPKFDLRRVAHGYLDGEDRGAIIEKAHAPDGFYWNLRGNGGMLSTVSEMFQFYRALYSTTTLLKEETRALMFNPREPNISAGSDLVSFFMYDREPEQGVEIFVATTSTELRGPRVRDAIAEVFGLPTGQGGPGAPGGRGGPGRRVEMGSGQAPTANGAKLPPLDSIATPAAELARTYFRLFNAGDSDAMRKFLNESTVKNPADTRTIDDRLKGYRDMRGRMGTLTPVSVAASSPTEITINARSSEQGELSFTLEVEPTPPHRMTSLRIAQ